jgi:pilus assembly protein TadC
MDYTVERFVRLAILLSVVFTLIFTLPMGVIMTLFVDDIVLPLLLVAFATLILTTYVFIRLPYFNKQALGRKIEAEVAVTGRRLLIQLESGKSLVNSIIDVAKNKKESSKALERVAYELYMGTPLEQAIQRGIDNSPSPTFRKIFVQIRNSLKTGSDLKHTLKATLEEVTREKIIEFETFGKKLNPLGLFYMIFGTIGPSLGIVLFVIFLTILKFPIKAPILSTFILAILAIQLFFIVVFSRMRPELEL